MNKKEQELTTKIEFRIIEIKKISYFEKDFLEFELKEEDITHGNLALGLELKIDGEQGVLSFIIKANFYYNKDSENYELFGVEALYRFQVKDFKSSFACNKVGEYKIPDGLMLTFLDISTSGTRGMLSVLNTNPAYRKIILPLVDKQQLLSSLKKRQ